MNLAWSVVVVVALGLMVTSEGCLFPGDPSCGVSISGASAFSGSLYDNMSTDPERCGKHEEPCCSAIGLEPCAPGLICAVSSVAKSMCLKPCGGAGEHCCGGDVCLNGFFCVESSKGVKVCKVRNCGGKDSPCPGEERRSSLVQQYDRTVAPPLSLAPDVRKVSARPMTESINGRPRVGESGGVTNPRIVNEIDTSSERSMGKPPKEEMSMKMEMVDDDDSGYQSSRMQPPKGGKDMGMGGTSTEMKPAPSGPVRTESRSGESDSDVKYVREMDSGPPRQMASEPARKEATMEMPMATQSRTSGSMTDFMLAVKNVKSTAEKMVKDATPVPEDDNEKGRRRLLTEIARHL